MAVALEILAAAAVALVAVLKAVVADQVQCPIPQRWVPVLEEAGLVAVAAAEAVVAQAVVVVAPAEAAVV